MSLLAAITVNQCDGCRKVEVLQTSLQYDSFEATWFDGLNVHFCPVCREKAENQERIMEDHRVREHIRMMGVRHNASRQSSLATDHSKENYVH